MTQGNQVTRLDSDYGVVAKTNHWLTAALILALLVSGVAMTEGGVEGDLRASLYTGHKTMGILVILLTVFRLIWRHFTPPPKLPVSIMPIWQIHAARAAHLALYLLLILVPLTGWVMSSLGPYGIKLFGVLPFPAFPFVAGLEFAESLRGLMRGAHGALAIAMATILVVHVGAAFLHHFVDRDDVLLRMSPLCLQGWLKRIRG